MKDDQRVCAEIFLSQLNLNQSRGWVTRCNASVSPAGQGRYDGIDIIRVSACMCPMHRWCKPLELYNVNVDDSIGPTERNLAAVATVYIIIERLPSTSTSDFGNSTFSVFLFPLCLSTSQRTSMPPPCWYVNPKVDNSKWYVSFGLFAVLVFAPAKVPVLLGVDDVY